MHVRLFVDVYARLAAVSLCAHRSFYTVATVGILKIKMCARPECFMKSNLTSAWLVFTHVMVQGKCYWLE